ncbi:MAG: hypothetical protein IJ626_00015 [Muribaculaceae bacterium]|nr:hypothetical protein [Muribaculaceae bacterium]
MKRYTSLLLLILIAFVQAKSQNAYRVVQSGEERIMTGSIQFYIDDTQLMARAMMWALNQADQLMNNIEDHDYKRGQIQLKCVCEGKESNYQADLTLQVKDHRLVYHFGNIEAKKVSGIKKLFGGSTQFNRLQPEKNDKHRKMIADFEKYARSMVEDISAYIDANEVRITNWSNVETGKLQNGMSEDEVWLIYGKPINRQEMDSEAQLLYDNFMHIFTVNGIVTSVVR